MIAHSPWEAGSAWLGRGFKPHPDVDAIAVEVVAFDDQVA
jgi:hypothetical protein